MVLGIPKSRHARKVMGKGYRLFAVIILSASSLPFALVFSACAPGAVVIAAPRFLNSSDREINDEGGLSAFGTEQHDVPVRNLLLEGVDAVVDDVERNRVGRRGFLQI